MSRPERRVAAPSGTEWPPEGAPASAPLRLKARQDLGLPLAGSFDDFVAQRLRQTGQADRARGRRERHPAVSEGTGGHSGAAREPPAVAR